MAETEQTKVCPLCAETIKAAAKICRHCRKRQQRWAFMSMYDFGAILAVLIFIGAVFLFISSLESQRDFGMDRDKIRVLDVHFSTAKEGSTTNLVAVGIVTNESEHSWIIDQFEIRYLDANGKLLGVDHEDDDYTILPKSDLSFSVDLDSDVRAPAHAAFKVSVISARDPRVPFQIFGP